MRFSLFWLPWNWLFYIFYYLVFTNFSSWDGMTPDLLYGCLHLCYPFQPRWVCIPIQKTLNIAHKFCTFYETFIVLLHSFWNWITSVSIHCNHWKEWPTFLLLCSTEQRKSYRFEIAWEQVRQSVCFIVCWPSARITIQFLSGWFIISHYSKDFFSLIQFMSVWLLFCWNLKKGYFR